MQTRTLPKRTRVPKYEPTEPWYSVSPFAIAWFVGFMTLAGFLFYKAHTAPDSVTKPIGEVQLGERTTGKNPLLTDLERANIPEVDPATWRKLELEMVKPNGKLLWIKLLWPLKDIKAAGAEVGKTIDLFMWEMGAVGPANVVSIAPCPPIQPGEGNVVTGIFIHEPDDDMINVHVEGLDEPIGCTANHPFWSEDRHEFVAAGELKPGEQLRTRHVGTASIASITPRPKDQLVYNLQVHGEHVFEVADQGVLVHNTCSRRPLLLGRFMDERVIPVAKEMGYDWYKSAPRKYPWSVIRQTTSKELRNQMIEHNKSNNVRWLKEQILAGREVFDIGVPNGVDAGPFVTAERELLHGMGYVMKPQGLVKIGEQWFPLFKWVKP